MAEYATGGVIPAGSYIPWAEPDLRFCGFVQLAGPERIARNKAIFAEVVRQLDPKEA